MDTEKQVAALIQEAYRKLKSFGDETGLDSDDPEPESAEVLKEASQLLNKALKADYENEEIKFALKSMDWWIVHISRIEGIQNPYEKGEFILSMLRKYYSFLRTLSDAGDLKYDNCQYVVRRFVFSSALRCFRDLLGDGVNQHDPGLLLLVGRCYKGVGVYEEAARYIEQAARFRRDDSETLAELADVSAMLGETGKAKALFREAFFINPAGVDLRMMESGMILCLRDKLAKEKKGMGEDALRDWMPVYGKLWGVFSVIRELKPIEAGRLKQSIFAMETECRGNPGRAEGLKPRLINKYFWLIDYYDTKREDQLLRDEVLLKIKVTDPEIYERYIQ